LKVQKQIAFLFKPRLISGNKKNCAASLAYFSIRQ
jgi:hypothetical protein